MKEFEGLAEHKWKGKVIPYTMLEIIKLNKHKGLDHNSLYFLGGTFIEAGSDTT